MTFPKAHWKALFVGAVCLALWYYLNKWLGEANAAIVGPEFLTKLAVKVFGFVIAYFVTFYGDRLLAPTIATWCDGSDDSPSSFEKAWKRNPNDPRLKICSDYYRVLFIGTLIAVSL